MNTRLIALAAAAAIAGSLAASPSFARDEIKIAGSSTVLPYAKIVAEQFQKANSKFKVIVESGGSGAGINQFCKGVGPEFIDIANSSRAIKSTELEACAAAGVKEVVEVKFGYDGIVFASDVKGAEFKFEPKDWFLRPSLQKLWSTASSPPIRTRPGSRSTPLSRNGRSPPTSPAKSTARAKSSKRRFCTPAARPLAPTS